ncbi:MAG: endolytic transglycosylase MltG [Acidimicrobiales bacterium]
MLEYHDDDDVEYLPWDDEDDFVAVRPAGFRMLRAVLALVILAAISWFLYNGIRGWFETQLDPPGDPGANVTFVVPSGATTGDIAQILEDNGVVPNSTFFRYFAEWKGEGNFQAGEYTLQENSSAEQAIDVLKQGPVPPTYNRYGVREGLWVSEMLPLIADQVPGVTTQELSAVLASGQIEPRYRPDGVTSWEGLLFPAFYEIDDRAEPAEILANMSNEFARVTGELGYGAAETQLGRSAYEVIIVASMVEAEAKTNADRPRIARVIYNRLREQQSLDIDATCIYGYGERRIDLNELPLDETPTPGFACRVNPNLPPWPISAPGRASLEAAINPSEEPGSEEWIWYVLKDREGNHFFTESYDAFLEQKALSQEQGLF